MELFVGDVEFMFNEGAVISRLHLVKIGAFGAGHHFPESHSRVVTA